MSIDLLYNTNVVKKLEKQIIMKNIFYLLRVRLKVMESRGLGSPGPAKLKRGVASATMPG
jgi:hypothetical protein